MEDIKLVLEILNQVIYFPHNNPFSLLKRFLI